MYQNSFNQIRGECSVQGVVARRPRPWWAESEKASNSKCGVPSPEPSLHLRADDLVERLAGLEVGSSKDDERFDKRCFSGNLPRGCSSSYVAKVVVAQTGQRARASQDRGPGAIASITTCHTPVSHRRLCSSTVLSLTTVMACNKLFPSRSPACSSIRTSRQHRPGQRPRGRASRQNLLPLSLTPSRWAPASLAVDGCLADRRARRLSVQRKAAGSSIRVGSFSARKMVEDRRAPPGFETVPVFIDKHLSAQPRRSERDGRRRATPARSALMAGSSLPVTWRFPALEDLNSAGCTVQRCFGGVSRRSRDLWLSTPLRLCQCMVEPLRARWQAAGRLGRHLLEGDAVLATGDRGVGWSWKLLEHALGRSHTRNVGDINGQNTRDLHAAASCRGDDAQTKFQYPVAFVVEYVEGLRATVLILNGHVDDTNDHGFRINDSAGGETIVCDGSSCTCFAPPAPAF